MDNQTDTTEQAACQTRRISHWELLVLLLPAAILVWGMYNYLGYVKDDAYISYRYAKNLALGYGMVFNHGDRLEGYTNFLWIVLHAPLFWIGANPLVWSKLLGAANALGSLVLLWRMGRLLNGELFCPLNYLAPLLFASSTAVALWSMSGMAPILLTMLGLASMYLLWKLLDSGTRRDGIWLGILLALAALTRPEGHVFVLLAALVLIGQALRRRSIPIGAWWCAGLLLATLGPYHLWRVLYFGSVFPNTAYVKAAAGPEVWAAGWAQLKQFWRFNANGWLALALIPALIPKRHRGKRALLVLVSAFFMLYLVKVGRDEMKHYRLFLPAYGLFVLAAAEGLRTLARLRPKRLPKWTAFVLPFAAALWIAFVSLHYTYRHHYETTYLRQSKRSFQAMGAYMLKHGGPDQTAIFQDMGAAPYAAWPMRFVDPIGILNRYVAHELAAIGMNPFLRSVKQSQPGGREAVRAFDRRVEAHLIEQNADWVAFTAYVPRSQRQRFRRQFDAAEKTGDRQVLERLFAPRLRSNGYYHGLYNDSRFRSSYELERVWRRNNGYYLVLFRRAPGGKT